MVAEYLLQVSSSCNPISSWVADEHFALVYPDLVEKYDSRCFNDGNIAMIEEGGAGYSGDVLEILMEGNIGGLKQGLADHFLHMNPQFQQVDGPSMSLMSPAMGDALSSEHLFMGNINNSESSSNCEMPPLREMNSGMVHFEKHSNTALSAAADGPPPLRNINGRAQETEVPQNNAPLGVLEVNPSCKVMSISPMQEVQPMNGIAVGSFVPKITAEKDIRDSNTGEGDWKKRMVTGLPVVEAPSSRKAMERELNRGEVDTMKTIDAYAMRETTPNTTENLLSIKIAESLNTALERMADESRIEKLCKQLGLTFTCHVCGVDYTSQLALASHLCNHERSDSPEHRKVHRKRARRTVRYQCQYCVQSSWNKSALVDHIQVSHRKELKLLPSKRVKENISSDVVSPSTSESSGSVSSFKCPYCQNGFETDSALANHILTQHNKINLHEKRLVPYQCQYCEESLGNNSALVHHIQVSHRKELKLLPSKRVEGNFSSGVVSPSTSESSGSVSNFKCPYCQNGFETDDVLANHIATQHNKINLHEKRPVLYQCQYCEESLRTKSALVHHIQVSHRKKLKLLRSKRLKGNISNGGVSHSACKSSEPVSSYDCPYCQNGFETDSALAHHILTKHNKIKL